MVIEQRHGWTAQISKQPQELLGTSAWIQGPYGQAPDLSTYGYILMFATGDGVLAQLPLIRALTDAHKLDDVKTRSIKLVWQTDWYPECFRRWMQTLLDDKDIHPQVCAFREMDYANLSNPRCSTYQYTRVPLPMTTE